MRLEVGSSQFGFHLIPCRLFAFEMETGDRGGGLKWSDRQGEPCCLVHSVL